MYKDKLFTIWGVSPNLYGVMIAVGLILCCFVFLPVLGKKIGMEKSSRDFYETVAIIAIVAGFLSAMIFQWIYDLIKYGSASFDSMTFLGGLIGGVAAFTIITLIFAKPEVKKDFFKLLQVAMPCILIAHAFGRLGCFFAGCCYGKQTDGPFGMVFPDGGSVGAVLPTQLFEAAFLFLLCGITVLLIYKKIPYNVALYSVAYSVFRFILEFFRGDDRGGLSGLSPSQFWCIIMFIFGAGLLTLMLLYKYKKEKIPKKLLSLTAGFSGIYKYKEKEEVNENLKEQQNQSESNIQTKNKKEQLRK